MAYKRNPKGKKTSQRTESRRDKFDPKSKEDSAYSKKNNDASWYTVPGQLAKDVASLSFNNATGVPFNIGTYASVIPGTMEIITAPVPGISGGASSAVSVAAKNLFTGIRKANSGSTNYDASDLMMYILAMDSAYAYYAWMVRIYGVMRVYDQRNRYLGQNLAAISGGDVDTILPNLANFRAYINQYAIKLGAFNVPATLTLIKRHMWMFSNVYADENNIKGQFYLYQPAYFYRYDEYNGAGRLVAEPLMVQDSLNQDHFTSVAKSAPKTLNAIIGYGERLISALAGSQDINTMSGDILKAYDSNGVFKLDLIGEEFALAPVFSEEVLTQIHNTTFVGNEFYVNTASDPALTSFYVNQDTSIGYGAILCQPKVKLDSSYNKLLDFWKDDPTPEDVMVATRNMTFTYLDEATNSNALQTCGTEVPLFAVVTQLNATGNREENNLYTGIEHHYSQIVTVKYLSSFNEYPLLYLRGSDDKVGSHFLGELSNYTILDYDELRKMHDSALLSLLAVPLLGNVLSSNT